MGMWGSLIDKKKSFHQIKIKLIIQKLCLFFMKIDITLIISNI